MLKFDFVMEKWSAVSMSYIAVVEFIEEVNMNYSEAEYVELSGQEPSYIWDISWYLRCVYSFIN